MCVGGDIPEPIDSSSSIDCVYLSLSTASVWRRERKGMIFVRGDNKKCLGFGSTNLFLYPAESAGAPAAKLLLKCQTTNHWKYNVHHFMGKRSGSRWKTTTLETYTIS